MPYTAAVDENTTRPTPHVRGLEQRDAAGNVVAEISRRVDERLRHQRAGGAMEDDLDPFAFEQLAERLGIGVRADVQAGAGRDRGSMPGRQVVEHDHVMAGRQERVDRDGADVRPRRSPGSSS